MSQVAHEACVEGGASVDAGAAAWRSVSTTHSVGPTVSVLAALAFLLGGCASSAASPGPTNVTASGPAPVVASPSVTAGETARSGGCDSMSREVPTTIELAVDGRRRDALLYAPPLTTNGESSKPMPLVLMFHGYSSSPEDFEALTAMSKKADDAGFILVYPRAIENPSRWDLAGARDTTFVDALLTELEARLCVDTRRVYAAGHSMGGGMAKLIGCRLAYRVAAIASVSGLYGPAWGDPCNPSRAVPVVAFHGVIDPIVPYGGGPVNATGAPPVIAVQAWAADWARRNGCSGEPEVQPAIGEVEPLVWKGCTAPVELYRIPHGGHTWPGSAIDDPALTTQDISANDIIWGFFARQELPAPWS